MNHLPDSKALRLKGFTILELLVVLTVLIILISIAVPRLKGMRDNANISKANTELQTIQSAIESYYTFHSNPHVYPDDLAELPTASPQVMSNAMYDPFGATATTGYNYLVNGQYYVAWAAGLPGQNAPRVIMATNGQITY